MAQFGSAFASGAKGRRFKSSRPDTMNITQRNWNAARVEAYFEDISSKFAIDGGEIPTHFLRYRVFRAAYVAASFKTALSNNRHGAAVFRGGRVIATGRNFINKTHPQGSGNLKTIHAELQAITRALKTQENLNGYGILVVRINKNGEPRMSKPCKDCMRLIRGLGLTAVWTI